MRTTHAEHKKAHLFLQFLLPAEHEKGAQTTQEGGHDIQALVLVMHHSLRGCADCGAQQAVDRYEGDD